MALAELAEQLQIDQLVLSERTTGYTKGKELKILGAIGEGKALTSVPSAASRTEDPRQGREERSNGRHRNRKMVTGTSVAASPLSCRNRVSGYRSG